MKKTTLLIVTFLLAHYLYAQETIVKDAEKKSIAVSKEQIPVDPNVRIGTLSNGLKYYIRNNGKPANKMVLRLAVNAGSILEDDDQLGVAHFMEHMNFNGTKNFKKNDLVDYLQSIGVKFGAHLNAYTSFDETVYILPIPTDNEEKLDKGFQILEDWAFNALLTDEEIDNERGVVLEEYRNNLGADKRMLAKYLPVIMNGSKYADRLPIGTKESIENFTYEAIRRFKKDWYRPDLMAVVAVGDVDVAKMEAKIKKYFDKPAPKEAPRKREVYTIPNNNEPLIAIATDPEATFNRVQLMYKDKGIAKPMTTVEDYKKSIVRRLFSQMINNRLNELRESENPPFVFGSSSYGGTYARTKNAYQSFAMTSADGQLKGLKALLQENERVKRHGFTKSEFERAKKDIFAFMEKAYQNKDKNQSDRYVNRYVQNFLNQTPMPGIEWEFEYYKRALPAISIDEVNNLIQSYLHKDNRVVVLTGAEKEGVARVTKQQVLDLMNEVESSDIKAYEERELASSLITELPRAGSIVKEVKNKDLGTTTITLSNGAVITFKKTDFKADEVLMDAFSYGGTSLYSNEEYKKVALANGGLTEAGVNGFNKIDMGKMLSGKIANVRPYVSASSEGMSGNATPKDLETLFQLTHLYFTSLNKDEKAYGSFIAKQKAFLGNLMANPNIYFQIANGNFLNKGNPRYVGFPTPEMLDKSDYNLAYQKYKERFANAGDFNFYFVGNFDETKLRDYAKKYIGSLPSTKEKEMYKVHDFRPLSGAHENIVKKGKEQKSNVIIRFTGETTYNRKEHHLLKSLGEILSIKLIEKLREEESGVYGVGARGSMSKIPYGSYDFRISFPCGPENVQKLKDAALKELQNIVDNGPEAKDVEKIKQAQLIEHKENLKKNRHWLSALKNADYNKMDKSKITKFTKDIDAINAADLQKTAKKYLSGEYIFMALFPEDTK